MHEENHEQYKRGLLERFFNYVSFDTQSKFNAKTCPSSSGQLKLAKFLQQELSALGLQEIELNKQGVLTAFLPSNLSPKMPTIGFISHLDTSPQCSSKNALPEVIENYRGGDISLGIGEEFISPVYHPFLQKLIGKTLIVGDGKNVIGAENKAGMAEIMTALYFLRQNRTPHCNIRVAFVPDKEIGQEMKYFPFEKFVCDWAYCLAGEGAGSFGYENINIATATVVLYGRNIQAGLAKGKMCNALTLACEFQKGLPAQDIPEKTEGKQGFFHLESLIGDIEKVEMRYLICDFDAVSFEQRKAFLAMMIVDFNRKKRLRKKAQLSIEDQYGNMGEVIKQQPKSIQLADLAMKQCDIEPIFTPIRSGYLGAKLAEKQIPCPMLFTGGYNFHSKQELTTLEGMWDATRVIVKLVELANKMAN
ncbi:peptidase T [Avibacterium paragallinarum]|uniref:Peptidase T n=1 Tax=Avibacterium paragallinarum TaxID=728 RepID=A0A0F5EZH1_AVIPA|nr:peptidase T [Avibacterium paragallinarum]KAA6209141.1 peptidase T [Avibacterium paragallinarum]KKB01765.1 peptidase T [Avibacterium paragallinarum]RZN71745.1 peptidase T [Avibacterium paragallinarum]SUU97807.1 Peptidase T [Avibacterium paragallinarum]